MLNTKQKILKKFSEEFYSICEPLDIDSCREIDDEVESFLSKALDEVEKETRKEFLEEIIRDIPVCEDKFSKCSCTDHDMQDGIMDYLNGLK